MKQKVSKNLRFWKYLLFGILTFGLYDLYFYYELLTGINEVCAYVEDGDRKKKEVGFGLFLARGILSFGIYYLYLIYQYGNRMKESGKKYGLMIKEDGRTYLFWNCVGFLLLGTGPLIGLYYLLWNYQNLETLYLFQMNTRIEEHQETGKIEETKKIEENERGMLLCTSGEYKGGVFNLIPGQSLVVGRSPDDCNIVIYKKKDVSRIHCVIKMVSVMPTYYEITDYSTLGTSVNGKPLKKEVAAVVKPGDTISLGEGGNQFLIGPLP